MLIHTILSYKAEEYKSQHHIAFLKERPGISCRSQDITTVEKNVVNVESFLCCLLLGHNNDCFDVMGCVYLSSNATISYSSERNKPP